MGARFQLKRLGAGESFSCGESVATDFVLSLSLLFVCLFPRDKHRTIWKGKQQQL